MFLEKCASCHEEKLQTKLSDSESTDDKTPHPNADTLVEQFLQICVVTFCSFLKAFF